jgi:hypothetical protein
VMFVNSVIRRVVLAHRLCEQLPKSNG